MAFENIGTEVEKELGWEDTIEKESSFILLPEGDYLFKVTAFQRERHNGSDKLPPCNKAVLTIEIDTPQGAASIRYNLFLHSRTEGMISAFFLAIGQKKHGEPFKMNWNKVIGATGACHVKTKTYEGKEYNEIKKFYDPEKDSVTVINSGAQQKAYQPGAF